MLWSSSPQLSEKSSTAVLACGVVCTDGQLRLQEESGCGVHNLFSCFVYHAVLIAGKIKCRCLNDNTVKQNNAHTRSTSNNELSDDVKKGSVRINAKP